MRKNTVFQDKAAGETRRYALNWAPYLATGDAPVGALPAVVQTFGTVTIEANTIDGTVQTLMIAGGDPGYTCLRLSVETAQGETLEQDCCFFVI